MRGRPRTREVKFCKECGNEIGRNNKSFCSRACRNIFYNKHPDVIEKICVVCGKTFMAQRHNRIYCSTQCNNHAKGVRTKEQRKGQKKPQGKIWNEKRQRILKEQNNQCWLCDKKLEDKFELHHMEYGDHSVESESLVVLCKSCHNRIHHCYNNRG